MGIANDWQLISLFLAAGLGFLFGLVFDILRVLRETFRFSAVAVFAQDVLFCVASALVLFFFLLPITGGEVRGYLLCGVLAGAVAYVSTVGRALPRLGRFCRRGICRLAAPLKKLSGRLKSKIRAVCVRIGAPLLACGRFCAKKVKNFVKKVLHIGR